MKEKITIEEYEKLFERDENGCYTNLIIPAVKDCPEMNLIGKKPEDYTTDEIIRSKTFRNEMWERITGNNINFSEIVSRDILQNYINKGIFKPLYLIGLDFGGSSGEDNIVYVPSEFVKLKEQIDEKLKKYIKEGNKVKFNCDLKYIGNSVVPSKIIINYTLNEVDEHKEEILIWGEKEINNSIDKKDIKFENNYKSNDKSKYKNIFLLIFFGIVVLIIDFLLILDIISDAEYTLIPIIIIMLLGAALCLYSGIHELLCHKKSFLKRNYIVKIIDRDPSFKSGVRLAHIMCSLDYLEKTLNNFKYKVDNRFVTFGRLNFLKKEILEKLYGNDIYGAMINLDEIIRGESHMFSLQDIPNDGDFQMLLNKLDKYYKDGYICQQEKEFILEVINIIKSDIEKRWEGK